jgi:hypothetical protein
MMSSSSRNLAALATAVVLSLTACSVGTGESSCENSECTVSVTGEANVQISDLDATLEVHSIGADEAVVEVDDKRATIKAGDTATVGGLSVKVVSASDGKAEFEVTRAAG